MISYNTFNFKTLYYNYKQMQTYIEFCDPI